MSCWRRIWTRSRVSRCEASQVGGRLKLGEEVGGRLLAQSYDGRALTPADFEGSCSEDPTVGLCWPSTCGSCYQRASPLSPTLTSNVIRSCKARRSAPIGWSCN